MTCVAIFASGCVQDVPELPSTQSREIVIPQAGPGISLYGQNKTFNQIINLDASIEPRVAMNTGQLLQQVIQQNLDSDATDEQIVIYKLRDDTEDLLRIAIADFDEVRKVWMYSWQAATRANNIKTFSVRAHDLTADGLPEIAGSGVSAKGEQTLDIFRIGSAEFPLQFESVISVSADIGVELKEPEGVAAEISATGAFPPGGLGRPAQVITLSKDLESQNPLDMVRTLYTWRPNQGQFIVAATEKILGAQVQEAQMDQLFRGTTEDFESFLNGAWVRTVNGSAENNQQLLFFDPENHNIRLIENDRMESHEWVTSHKPSFGGRLQIFLINESFRSLKSVASISPTGIHAIGFALQDRDDWTGEFRRLTDDTVTGPFATDKREISLNTLVLSGLYRSESGIEIVFTYPRFTWRQGDQRRQGSFLSYYLNDTVLEMTFVNANGLVEEHHVYIMQLVERSQGNVRQGSRLLRLVPAAITVNGIRVSSPESILLEQVAESGE